MIVLVFAAGLAQAAPGCEAPAAGWARASRPAAGSLVGVTLVLPAAPPGAERPATDAAAAALDAAYARMETFEAELSEWREDSLSAALNRSGGPQRFSPLGEGLYSWLVEVERRSGGAFSPTWRGGHLSASPEGWRVQGGTVGLGGALKGFLAERAADALEERGFLRFLVDAAGDLVARGAGPEGGCGWEVGVQAPDGPRRVRLVDEALSTSDQGRQPGHLRDPRTGAPAGCGGVSVIAPDGMVADALATASFVRCDAALGSPAQGVYVRGVDGEGRPFLSAGARRRFPRW